MSACLMAGLLAAQLAAAPAPQQLPPGVDATAPEAPAAAPAPPAPAQVVAPSTPPSQLGLIGDDIVIPAQWARRPFNPPVRTTVADLLDEAREKPDVHPQRFSAGPVRETKYDDFAVMFSHAKIPSCLGPGALKHQPPKIGPIGVGGLLALPFLAVAAIRGKCN